jgi:rRNA maturation endonuclease Nob1
MNNEEKGTWEMKYKFASIRNFRCSKCKKTCPQGLTDEPIFMFCPYCGSPMEIQKYKE